MEGNHIDTGKRQRMLRTNVLREAEKPSGDVKTLADSTEVQPLIFEFIYFIFLWQFDGHVCTVEHVGYPCAYHVGSGLQRKEIVIGTQTTGGNVVTVVLHHISPNL